MYDTLIRFFTFYTLDIYQCEDCNRIHIQQPRSNHFHSFSPEDKASKNAIKGIQEPDEKH